MRRRRLPLCQLNIASHNKIGDALGSLRPSPPRPRAPAHLDPYCSPRLSPGIAKWTDPVPRSTAVGRPSYVLAEAACQKLYGTYRPERPVPRIGIRLDTRPANARGDITRRYMEHAYFRTAVLRNKRNDFGHTNSRGYNTQRRDKTYTAGGYWCRLPGALEPTRSPKKCGLAPPSTARAPPLAEMHNRRSHERG